MISASVSVVIPAFNAAAFIEETLESVLAQTVRPAEIIVVDDGSEDSTRNLVDAYAGRGVTLIEHGQNRGLPSAFNTVFNASSGKFIAILGHDDVWLPHKLERQLQLFERAREIEICFTDYVEFGVDPQPGTGFGQRDDALRRYPRRDLGDGFYAIASESFLSDMIRLQATPMPSTVLACRAAVAKVMPLDDDVSAEDVQMFFRLAKLASFAYVDEPLMRRRMHRQNLGRTMGQLRWLDNHVKALQRLPSQVELTADESAAVDGLLAEYLQAAGYTAFTGGDLERARMYYRELLASRRSLKAAMYWGASFLPRAAVEALRRTKQAIGG